MANSQEFKEAVHAMKAEMPQQIALVMMKAELCREYYIELVSQGFSKDEALELCKHFKL